MPPVVSVISRVKCLFLCLVTSQVGVLTCEATPTHTLCHNITPLRGLGLIKALKTCTAKALRHP